MLNNSSVNNSKLFLMLRALSKKELKQFDLWLASPFFNNSNKILNLYRGIIKHKKRDKPIDKHQLLEYAKIKKGGHGEVHPKDDLLLRQTMSALTGQVQEFLVWQRTKEDKTGEKRHLMDALIERKLYKLVPAILSKACRELESSPHRNAEYYENFFLMKEMEFYLNVILNNRDTKTNIQDLIDALWQAQLSKTLLYYCAAKNGETILKDSYKYPMINAIKEFIGNDKNQATPIVRAHCILLSLIEKQEDKYFYELKKCLFENISFFDVVIVRQFLNHLINYGIKAIKIGKNEFIQQNREIYKLGLKLSCWSTGVVFSNHLFINIARNALRIEEIDWANAFVEQYKRELHPDVRNDIVSYYYALVAFKSEQYDRAQDHLIKIVSPEDFIYHLRFKVLLIKIYYEQQPLTIEDMDIYPISHQLDAIRHYVMSTRNTKMSEPVRESYNNFVRLLKRILNSRKKLICSGTVKPKQLDKLRQELLAETPFVERQWLQEKIEELG